MNSDKIRSLHPCSLAALLLGCLTTLPTNGNVVYTVLP